MSTPPDTDAAGLDLSALDAVTDAVESGAGLPEIVRAASRALGASLVLADRSGATVAVAARSTADDRALQTEGAGVEVVELRVADLPVGTLRVRTRGEPDPMLPAVMRLVTTLIAGEVGRIGAPERASEEAASTFLGAVLDRTLRDPAEILEHAEALGIDPREGSAVIVARSHPKVTTDDGWRQRLLAIALRGSRAVVPTVVAALSAPAAGRAAGEVVVLLAGVDDEAASRAADGVLRELSASLQGHTFAVGRSRVTTEPGELHRAGSEALLAANVAEGAEDPLLAFEETGAYRLLLSAMSEDPAELQRFYSETVEPLVAYDDQYETDLVQTVEAFLDADGNVAGTAQRLFTHRHTIRYRLERVRDLSGLDVSSTDGREKLSLGLKAMRVLGIAHRPQPAAEAEGAPARRDRRRGGG